MAKEDLIGAKEAAEILNVTVMTIGEMRDRQELRAVTIKRGSRIFYRYNRIQVEQLKQKRDEELA